jgi:class 3 adenylate cyclase
MPGLKLRIEGYSLTSERVERRLAAVLAADVAGFSRLSGADEEGVLVQLRALRAEVINPEVVAHGGRVFKFTGDGFLAEFCSFVEANWCALEIQRASERRNANLPPIGGSTARWRTCSMAVNGISLFRGDAPPFQSRP